MIVQSLFVDVVKIIAAFGIICGVYDVVSDSQEIQNDLPADQEKLKFF